MATISNWIETDGCAHKGCKKCAVTGTSKGGEECIHPFTCFCPDCDENVKDRKWARENIRRLASGVLNKMPDTQEIHITFSLLGKHYSTHRSSWAEINSLMGLALDIEEERRAFEI